MDFGDTQPTAPCIDIEIDIEQGPEEEKIRNEVHAYWVRRVEKIREVLEAFSEACVDEDQGKPARAYRHGANMVNRLIETSPYVPKDRRITVNTNPDLSS